MMNRSSGQLTLAPLAVVLFCSVSGAQEVYPLHPNDPEFPSEQMTFFVTSEPIGDGGNLGGLEGADAHCQALAAAVGHGDKTWRAYLSTQERPGQPAVDARDRIGEGPWFYPKAGTIDYLGRNLARPIIKSESCARASTRSTSTARGFCACRAAAFLPAVRSFFFVSPSDTHLAPSIFVCFALSLSLVSTQGRGRGRPRAENDRHLPDGRGRQADDEPD